MLNHPTTKMGGDGASVGLVLVGPVASGKSTALKLLGDLGVETLDVTEKSRLPTMDTHTAPFQHACQNLVQSTTAGGVCAVEGFRIEEEVQWFAELVDRHLVVRIDTFDERARQDRYVQRELDVGHEIVTEARLADLRAEFRRAEYDAIGEQARHHVRIMNDNSISTTDLYKRLSGLLAAFGVDVESVDPIDETVQTRIDEAFEDESEQEFRDDIDRIIEEDQDVLDGLSE